MRRVDSVCPPAGSRFFIHGGNFLFGFGILAVYFTRDCVAAGANG